MKSIVRKTHVVTPKLSHAKQQYRMDWNSWKEIKVFSFCVLYYSCGGTRVPNVPEAEQCSAHRDDGKKKLATTIEKSTFHIQNQNFHEY